MRIVTRKQQDMYKAIQYAVLSAGTVSGVWVDDMTVKEDAPCKDDLAAEPAKDH